MSEAAHSQQNENICIRWFSKQHIRGCRGDGCNLVSAPTSDQNKNTNFSRRSCFDLPHAKHSALWNVALAKTVPLRTPVQPVWAFEVHCLANQPRRDPALIGIHGASVDEGETHSTLINTWPHYLSHVAESHWGKFNTALLSWGMVSSFHVCVHGLCVYVWRTESKSFVHLYLFEHTCIFS